MNKEKKIKELIGAYNLLVQGIEKIAWSELDNKEKNLSFEKKVIKIPLNKDYIKRIKYKEVATYIKQHIDEYYFGLKVDVHVSVKNKFVLGVECKSYTENAMIKRILVDFSLLKTQFKNLHCVLFQLESQLTGDYCVPNKKIIYGSKSTHTLMSYFDFDLNIITLLDGERKVDEPIYKKGFYKELKLKNVRKTIDTFKTLLNDI